MKKELVLVLGTVATTAALTIFLLPPKIVEKQIPNIITRFDTVEVEPKWFADSVKKWKKRKATTDTVNIYTETVVIRDTGSTQYVYVGPDTSARPKVWPILLYSGGHKFGDTGTVATFDLKSGVGSISKVYISGYLTSIIATDSMQPKLTFTPFPQPKRTSIWTKLLWGSVGFNTCKVIEGIF